MINFIIVYVIVLVLCFEHGLCLPVGSQIGNVDVLIGRAVPSCIGCEEGTRRALPKIQRMRTSSDEYTVPQGSKRGMIDKIGIAAERSVKKNWFNVLNGVRLATNLGRQHRKVSTPQTAKTTKGGVGGGGGGNDEGGVTKGFKSSRGSSS